MAEVDLRHAVGTSEQISGPDPLEAESVIEKIGADTVKARTEGLEGEES